MTLLERKLPFVDTMLKGVGQIMLQENALTGLLFLAGIFYGGAIMGLAAVLAAFCGTLTAQIFGYDREEIKQGLCGFSAALVGVALTFYFQPVLIIWMAVIVGSVLATVLQHLFIVKKIPVFTLPFVLVAWVMIYLFRDVHPLEPSIFVTAKAPAINHFTMVTGGFGQVIFQGGIFAGIVFLAGVAINSPIAAIYGILGAVAGAILSAWFSAPAEGIGVGLFSYNAVLCAITFSGTRPKDAIWASIAVLCCVCIHILMTRYGLTILTFPFVAASCITLLLRTRLLPKFYIAKTL